jgi:L-ribulose-5-phosphate 3-epimerase
MNRRDFIGGAGGAALAASVLAPAYGGEANRPKKSVMFSMLPGNLSLDDRFKMAKDVGFEGVECSPVGSEKAAKDLRAAAERAGIPIQSVIYGGWDAPLSDPDPAVIAKGLTNARSAMQDAKWMGAEDILLVPAVVTARVRYQDAYERSQKHVRSLIPTAEKLNIMVCIEEVWNNFLLSPMEFAHYIDSFKHPLVQAYFDVGNVVTFGWPEDWIRTLGKRIKKVHLKDYKGGPGLFGGNKGSFVMLREGSINWPEVRRAFAEIGYTGYMNTELGGGDEAYLRDVSARVDKILAGE